MTQDINNNLIMYYYRLEQKNHQLAVYKVPSVFIYV